MSRWFLIIAFVGCHRAPDPAPAASRGDYCRARGTFAPLPLGTQTGSAIRPAHTFSIVARDPVTGDLGVAVQSHWFSVGAMVTWAEPGIGAIATQSFVEPSYGPKGLALMHDGVAAPEAMQQLIAADKQSDVRQLGFIDAQGHAATHTGAKCIQFAGGHVGDNYAVQANIMGNDKVVPAMSTAYEAAKGDLADRMLAALDAAQAVGGDLRGCQSAAILVVSGKRSETPWKERKLDLRVEDDPAPIEELHRLVTLARAYDQMNQGDESVEKGDMKGAVEHYGTAATAVPDNMEMKYWQAVALAGHGQVDAAIPMFRASFAADPGWAELTRRLTAPGILPDTAEGHAIVERILREAR
ncbi:MAG: Zn-dependent protease [Myxococcales bacterium]|nr:Zn-dependent protease [Myxococcales bacterium]